MSYEYRITTLNDSYLKELGKDCWFLNCINNNKMYFSREVKRNIKQSSEITNEYNQFKILYPKSSGITSPQVINKVNKLVKEGKYQEMIDGVTKYVKFVKVNNSISKFILNPLTFLNQERWKDGFDIIDVKVGASEAWMNIYLESLEPNIIDKVLKKKKEWCKKYPAKEFTKGTLENIINWAIGKTDN